MNFKALLPDGKNQEKTMPPMQYMIQMRRANKSIPAILCIIIFILLFLPKKTPVLQLAEESDSGSGSVDPYVMNTYAASHIQVANVSLDPSVLMPGDIATATIVMENTGRIYRWRYPMHWLSQKT